LNIHNALGQQSQFRVCAFKFVDLQSQCTEDDNSGNCNYSDSDDGDGGGFDLVVEYCIEVQ